MGNPTYRQDHRKELLNRVITVRRAVAVFEQHLNEAYMGVDCVIHPMQRAMAELSRFKDDLAEAEVQVKNIIMDKARKIEQGTISADE